MAGEAPDELRGSTAPTYEQAPPTLEDRESPFHPRFAVQSRKATTPGMASPSVPAPRIGVAVVRPVAIGTPVGSAGATLPARELADSSRAPIAGIDDDTPLSAGPRPVPEVPAPGSPTFEVSRSLRLDAAAALELARGKPPARPRRRHAPQPGPGPSAPTYQMLPALSRTKKREGSDLPLVAALLGLAVIIAVLLGAVVYGVVTSRGPAPAVEPSGERG